VRDVLSGVSLNLEEGIDAGHLEMIEAIEGDLLDFQDEASENAELLQLGLAIAIINHEFESSIRSIRGSLRELHQWARSNGELDTLYRRIRTNFDHLDGHLNLFTPLQRRLYRSKVDVTGAEIHHYVATLFEARFARHSIKLEVADAFLESVVSAFPSTLYPVFVNIIDNACFWLRDFAGRRSIRLDVDEFGYLISNSGPGVEERDSELIFEKGVSRKPRGMGLGLYISVQSLQREGMDLKLVKLDPPTFRLVWPKGLSINQ
jgi:signal transduction histidine kinase